MGYQITVAPSARRDLRDIVRYISWDSPVAATRFSELLLNSIKRLADFPELGRVVPEIDAAHIREIVVRSYRIIYLVNHSAQRIDVVRFWHAARGLPDLG